MTARVLLRWLAIGCIIAITSVISWKGLKIVSAPVASAQDALAADVGPVPQDGLSRTGRGAINKAIISPDERRVAVSTHIGVYMYDAATMQQLWYSEGYDLLPVPIAFSPDSTRLVGGHNNGHYVTWNVETGEIIARYDYPYSIFDITFSGDGRSVLGTGSEVVAWDAETAELKYTQSDFYSLLTTIVAASPDGTMFATAGMTFYEWDEIAVRDAATGEVKRTFTISLPEKNPTASAIQFTPDSKYLFAGFTGGWIIGWDLETGTMLYTIQSPDDWIGDIHFSSDSRRMAVGASYVYVFSVEHGSLNRSYHNVPLAIYSPWFTADGTLKSLATKDEALSIVDVFSGAELARLEGHRDANLSAALTPDGATLILGKFNGTLEVRDVASRAVRNKIKGTDYPYQLAVSPDGTTVAGVFLYNRDTIVTHVIAWDLASGQQMYTIPDQNLLISDIQFSPDSATLLISYSDNTIRRVDARTGETVKTTTDFVEQWGRVILAPDGNTIALIGGDLVTLWDLSTLSPIREFTISTEDISFYLPSTAVFSADGALLGLGDVQDYDSSIVGAWNVETGQPVAKIDDGLDHGAFAGVVSIAFSRDHSLMAAGIYDGTILVVDTRSGQLVKVLRGHGDIVAWMEFLPQTGQLASVSNDGTVVFWQVP